MTDRKYFHKILWNFLSPQYLKVQNNIKVGKLMSLKNLCKIVVDSGNRILKQRNSELFLSFFVLYGRSFNIGTINKL